MANIQTVYDYFCNYLKVSPTSIIFSVFFLATAILEIIREVLIWQEKKRMAPKQRCQYLLTEQNSSNCDLPEYRQGFRERGNNCTGCAGKTVSIKNEDAIERMVKRAPWKLAIILMANYSRNILPYASFLYTLSIAIFKK